MENSLKCPKHQDVDLIFDNNYKQFFCKECNALRTKEEWEEIALQNELLLKKQEDKEPWFEKAYNEYPTIIAHEYNRLKELSTEGKVYGTFMQIKDMYEVILKFPILIMINGLIYSLKNEKECKNRNDILKSFISKPLSLGDWETIANKIGKLSNEELPQRNSEMYVEIRDHLKELMNYYKVKINNTEKLVSSWRNDEIAHGALSFDNTKFKDEIEDMLKNIYTIMEKSEKFYSKIEVVTDKGEILKGHEIKTLNGENEILIKYILKSQDSSSELTPFIYNEIICDELINVCYTYMFDSFVHYTNTAYSLNYSHGKKNKCYKSVDTLLELKKLLNVQELENESIERENHLTVQLQKIEEILKSKKLIKPTYLNDYFLSRLGNVKNQKSYTKGVFMIRADRGMGKTIFTKILDDLDYTSAQEEKPAYYNKVIKRVYHINNTYASELSTFKHILQNNLCSTLENSNAYVGQIREEFSKLDFCQDIETLKKQFAQILKMAFEELNRAYKKESGIEREKFLLVIDGLDELNYKYEIGDKTILDYIPKPDMLEDGIFIFLTSRTNEELNDSKRLQREIGKIELTESAEIITRRSPDYVALLKKHLEKNLLITNSEEQINLLESLDYRFSYLGAYEKLYSSNLIRKEDINPHNIIKSYLDYLQNTNRRHFENVKRLLLILAISPVGIKIEELCFLMNEQTVTYRLLGTIADMSNFIENKREDDTTVMYISHQDWKEMLLENYISDIETLLDEYRKIFDSFSKRLLLNPDDEKYIEFTRDFDKYRGFFYVLFHFNAINESFNLKNNVVLSDENIRKNNETLNNISDKLYVKDNKKERLLGRVSFLTGIITVINNLSNNNTDYILELSKVYQKRGMTRESLNYLDEALKDHEKATEIIEKLEKEGRLPDINDLVKVYKRMGIISYRLKYLKESLKYYNEAIEIIEKLNSEGKLQLDRNELASVHSGIGIVLFELDYLEEAEEENRKAIEIIENLDKEGKLLDRNDLARVYMIKGEICHNENSSNESSKESLKESLKYYDKVIEIRENLDKEGKLPDRNDLAVAYMNKGASFKSLSCLSYPFASSKGGKIIFEDSSNKSSGVYVDNGITLTREDCSERAIEEYRKAIEIRESLDKEGKLPYRDDLAKVFIKRGDILADSLGRLKKALKEYEKAIEIRESLDKEGRLPYRDDLAKVYIKRANILNALGRLEEAVNDYSKAIEIREELDKEGRLINKNDLAKAYRDMGEILYNLNRLEETFIVLKKALNCKKSFFEEKPFIQGEYYYIVGFMIQTIINNLNGEGLDEMVELYYKPMIPRSTDVGTKIHIKMINRMLNGEPLLGENS